MYLVARAAGLYPNGICGPELGVSWGNSRALSQAVQDFSLLTPGTASLLLQDSMSHSDSESSTWELSDLQEPCVRPVCRLT